MNIYYHPLIEFIPPIIPLIILITPDTIGVMMAFNISIIKFKAANTAFNKIYITKNNNKYVNGIRFRNILDRMTGTLYAILPAVCTIPPPLSFLAIY